MKTKQSAHLQLNKRFISSRLPSQIVHKRGRLTTGGGTSGLDTSATNND